MKEALSSTSECATWICSLAFSFFQPGSWLGALGWALLEKTEGKAA